MKPLLPPPGVQPQLPGHAAAGAQLGRLLDALLVLDVQKSCSIGELANRVGLKPERLRELLSSFMVAGPEAVGPEAPFSVVFGTASGPLEADDDYDDDQADADYVFRASETLRDEQVALVDDVGRKPVTLDQVAAAVLAGRTLMESGVLEERHREAVAELVDKLGSAMHLTLREPVDPDAQKLRTAVHARQRVSFRYRDPAEGVDESITVEPYDVRRRRDSFVLDAGPDPAEGYRVFDIAAMSDVELVGDPGTFDPPSLPDREARDHPLDVILQVPAGSPAVARLRDGWQGTLVDEDDAAVQMRIAVDRPVASRVAILLLQLGPGCSVVTPESLQAAVVPVAQRVLRVHSSQPTGNHVHSASREMR